MRNVWALFTIDNEEDRLLGIYSTRPSAENAVKVYRSEHGDAEDLMFMEVGLDEKPNYWMMDLKSSLLSPVWRSRND